MHLYKITALICLIGVNCSYAEDSDQETQQDTVSEVFPYSIEQTHYLIGQEFNSDDRSYFEDYNGAIYVLPHGAKTVKDLSEKEYSELIAFPLVYPNKFYVFYGAYLNMQGKLQHITPETTALEEDNPSLQHYAALPQQQRENDFYLWSPDAPYWYSELVKNGYSMPFHSYFILHLSPQDQNHTVVEVIEDEPTAKFGKKLSVDSHGIVHHYDIRPVPPTVHDRKFLLSCISQFLERGIPSRKGFTCRE